MIPQYASDNVHKTLRVTISGQTLANSQVVTESMELNEAVIDGDNFEFVGCISSRFAVQLHGVYMPLKGKTISATIQADGTNQITIFNGIIDSVKLESNHDYQTIIAFDVLYTKGNVELASWYKSLSFPITLKAFRDSLFQKLGIQQVTTTLPNDSIKIKKQYNPKTLQSIIVIKSICQINCVFGIINRNGQFEYRKPIATVQSSGVYPSLSLYPPFAPGYSAGGGQIDPELVAHYEDINYQAYTVKPVDKITIRDDEDDEGQSYGSGQNNYIIQGNMFSYGLSKKNVSQMAQNLLPHIQNVNFQPYRVHHNGMPFIEVGRDFVQYHVLDYEASYQHGEYVFKTMNFPVYNRQMRGLQHLVDQYEARGEEYQRQFITDLNARIDVLKKNKVDLSNYYNKQEIDDMLSGSSPGGGGGGGSGWSVESVQALPPSGQPNVLYLIQGEVVVN